MAFFCYLGAFACCLLVFYSGQPVCSRFAIFYRGEFERGCFSRFFTIPFCPTLRPKTDAIKFRVGGFAAGYVSGALVLFLNLIFLNYAESLGVSVGMAVRICILTAGIWWGGFALITFKKFKKKKAGTEKLPKVKI